jgi:hypothetical protein
MSTTKRLALTMPVFAMVVVLVAGCRPASTSSSIGSSNTTTQTGALPTTPTSGTPTPAPDTKTSPLDGSPDVKLTAEEFYKEANKDNNFVINKHAGKLMELAGVVDDARLDFGGDPILFLIGERKVIKIGEKEITTNTPVNCPVADRNHWSKAFPGQTVTLRARAPKSINDPVLFKWHIKSVTGAEPPRMTAEEFVKEVVADPEAAETKYKDKHVILTGEVAEAKVRDKRLEGFTLSMKEKTPALVCYVTESVGGEKAATFVKGVAKPGQKVTVLVKFDAYFNKEISVTGHVIDPPY